jgi:hypothetical protein
VRHVACTVCEHEPRGDAVPIDEDPLWEIARDDWESFEREEP